MGLRELDVAPRVLAQFVAIVDAGELGEAATALGVPARTLSRALAALEAEVGEPLLLRRGERLELTPAGEAVSRTARDVLAALANLRGVAEADDTTLRVAHVGHADTLSILLDAFTRLRPEARLHEVTSADDAQVEQVRLHQLDVAVCAPVTPLSADLASVALRRDPLLSLGAPMLDDVPPPEHLAPSYGRAWPAHDRAVAELERRLDGPVARAPVPSGSGQELASLLRRARGRKLVLASSALPPDVHLLAAPVLDRHISWQLVWRREDRRALVRDFIESAVHVARQRDWTTAAAPQLRVL